MWNLLIPHHPLRGTLAENARLRRQVADLAAKLETGLAEIERLKRSGKRQATPFSKGSRKPDPGKPGRRPGAGPFRFRTAPAPDAVTGAVIAVPVARSACPRCGGNLVEAAGSETVGVTDLPPVAPAQTRAYQVAVVVA